MKDTVFETLSPLGVPILWNTRPDISRDRHTAICYQFFNEADKMYGDGHGRLPGGSLLVDVFSLRDYDELVAEVVRLMKAAGFRLADKRDSDDTLGSVKCYHKILVYNYIESEVKRNEL